LSDQEVVLIGPRLPSDRDRRTLDTSLDPAEFLRVVCVTSHCEAGRMIANDVAVFATNRRVIAIRERLFGSKIDQEVRLEDVASVKWGLLKGVGPAWVLDVGVDNGIDWIVYLQSRQECEVLSLALRSSARGGGS
jgi:hypothetical protein